MISIMLIILSAMINAIIYAKKGKDAVIGMVYGILITVLSLSLFGLTGCLVCSILGILISIIIK